MLYKGLLRWVFSKVSMLQCAAEKSTQEGQFVYVTRHSKRPYSSSPKSKYISGRLVKSHKHQIIPPYVPYRIDFTPNDPIFKFLRLSDALFSRVPYYFSIIVSFSSLFLLFFIFLNNYETITCFRDYNCYKIGSIEFYPPKNPAAFWLFYSTLLFYVILFLHSFLKLIFQLFDEVRCAHIYTKTVEAQYLLGIALFILSEAMLFFSFFWAFFHVSLTPSIFIGNCWPPLGITTLNPWHIPFLNTCILLTSGVTVNWFFFTLKKLTYFTFRSRTDSLKPSSNVFDFANIVVYRYIDFDARFQNAVAIQAQLIQITFQNINYFPSLYYYRRLIPGAQMGIDYVNKLNFIAVVGSVLNYFSFSFFYIFKSLLFSIFNKANNYFRLVIFSVINNRKLLYSNVSVLPIFWRAVYSQVFNVFINTFNLYFFAHARVCLLQFLTLWEVFDFYYYTYLSYVDSRYLTKLDFYKSFENLFMALIMTIYFGVLFLGFQYCEYKYYASFDLDNIYGTVFYALTSLHGFHVFVGILSLTMCFSFFHTFQWKKADLNKGVLNNFLIVFAVWYWHFVDVVWLFLFVVVYLWGS